MTGHAQLKFVMTECSKTQIRLTGLIYGKTTNIRGRINKFTDKCDNFVTRLNFDFIFISFLKKHICNKFQDFETSSCMHLCSMVTLATAEMPHGKLLFLEVCFHVQNSITSVFDIPQS